MNESDDISGNVMCYYLNSNAYKNTLPEELDPQLCTHIIYAFVNMDENGNLFVQNETIDIKKGAYKRITALKKQNPKLKVLLSIGGVSTDVFSRVAAISERRQNLAISAKKFMEKYNFDGIDVDWEKPMGNDTENFVLLLKDMKKELAKYGWLLSTAVYPNTGPGYNVPEISKNVDIINLMTYNYYGPWSTYTGYNAPIYSSSIENSYEQRTLNVNASVHQWIDAGAPLEKINIGLPFYGRAYTLVNETIHGIHAAFYKNECRTFTYRQICANFSNWTTVWDDEQKAVYKYEGSQWLSYDNEKSVREKVKYVVANTLAGVMIWHIGGDDVSGQCGPKQNLLRIVNEELHRNVTKSS